MKTYLLLFVFLSSIFLSHYYIAGQAVYGDGIDYWAHLHTWYFDRDLDFTNEFRHIYTPDFNNAYPDALAPTIQKIGVTVIGKTDNPHPPGTALILFPFYVFADLIVVLFRQFRNGYSDLYQIVSGLGTIFYTLAGVFLLEKFTSRKVAVTILLASPLLYYGSYDVLNSHFASFFVSCLFWYILFCLPVRRLRHFFLMGCVIGLATLIRVQDILLFIPFLLFIFMSSLRPKLTLIIIFVFAIFITCIPLVLQWLVLYGVPYPYFYLTSGHIYRGLTGSLFHHTNGLFFRTPLLFLSLAGLLLIAKRQLLLLGSYFLISFVLITYQGGWRDAAYGGRMYIAALPLFAVLLNSWLSNLQSKINPKIINTILGFFILLNLLSISSFVLLEKEVNSGKKTGLEEHTIRKLQKLIPDF